MLHSRIAQDPIIFDAVGTVNPDFLEDLIQACLRQSRVAGSPALTRLRQIVTSIEIAKIFNALGIEAGRYSLTLFM